MRANPRDWRIEDLESVAAEMLSVPARRPIKPVYVRRFISMIEKLTSHEDES